MQIYYKIYINLQMWMVQVNNLLVQDPGNQMFRTLPKDWQLKPKGGIWSAFCPSQRIACVTDPTAHVTPFCGITSQPLGLHGLSVPKQVKAMMSRSQHQTKIWRKGRKVKTGKMMNVRKLWMKVHRVPLFDFLEINTFGVCVCVWVSGFVWRLRGSSLDFTCRLQAWKLKLPQRQMWRPQRQSRRPQALRFLQRRTPRWSPLHPRSTLSFPWFLQVLFPVQFLGYIILYFDNLACLCGKWCSPKSMFPPCPQVDVGKKTRQLKMLMELEAKLQDLKRLEDLASQCKPAATPISGAICWHKKIDDRSNYY